MAIDEKNKRVLANGSEECRNQDDNFLNSKKYNQSENRIRLCQKSYFTKVHKLTDVKQDRKWLCYSPTKGRLFFSPCKVMNLEPNKFNEEGFNDWKNARIKEMSRYTEYIPCFAHSLNLVGKCAAECCPEALRFFSFVENIYTFFSASTHRWGNVIKCTVRVSASSPETIIRHQVVCSSRCKHSTP